jgi:hypothetical protein
MSESPGLPQPDPALRRLDLFVGRWSMKGHFVGSDEESIGGETTFRWLPGGFFLEAVHRAGLRWPQDRKPGADRLRPWVGQISIDGFLQPLTGAAAL